MQNLGPAKKQQAILEVPELGGEFQVAYSF